MLCWLQAALCRWLLAELVGQAQQTLDADLLLLLA